MRTRTRSRSLDQARSMVEQCGLRK